MIVLKVLHQAVTEAPALGKCYADCHANLVPRTRSSPEIPVDSKSYTGRIPGYVWITKVHLNGS